MSSSIRRTASPALEEARRAAAKLGIPNLRRHLLMCYDRDAEDCASSEAMTNAWRFLKERLKELGLTEQAGIFRSKSLCLDICHGGPILVVYPDGVWYGRCNPPVLERIIQEHLVRGCVVTEYVIARPASSELPAPTHEGRA